MTTFQSLFTPLQIGNVTVDNRIVVMPHTTLLSTDHLIGDRHVAYYEERAKGGAGLVIVETLIVHPTSQPLMNEAFAFDEREVPRYRELTAAVHRHGTRIFAQIAHGGRQLLDGSLSRPPAAAFLPAAQHRPLRPRGRRAGEPHALRARGPRGDAARGRTGLRGR